MAADFVPEEWLRTLSPQLQGAGRRWFCLYSQLHVKVTRRLPALEQSYSQLSRTVLGRGSTRHATEHEIVQKWSAMRAEKARRDQQVESLRAQHAQLEANLEHWELHRDEQVLVMKRRHQEMRREAQERIIANGDHCRERAAWETIFLRRDANLHSAVDELLRRALRSGIRLRGFAASVAPLDALGMLKVVLCAMLGELVGEHKGSRDDALPHQATQWPIKSPLAWVRQAGADAGVLAAVALQSIWRGRTGRMVAQKHRAEASAARAWEAMCRALRSSRMQAVVASKQLADPLINPVVPASDETPPTLATTSSVSPATAIRSPRIPPPVLPPAAVQARETAARCAELLSRLRASPASIKLKTVAEEPTVSTVEDADVARASWLAEREPEPEQDDDTSDAGFETAQEQELRMLVQQASRHPHRSVYEIANVDTAAASHTRDSGRANKRRKPRRRKSKARARARLGHGGDDSSSEQASGNELGGSDTGGSSRPPTPEPTEGPAGDAAGEAAASSAAGVDTSASLSPEQQQPHHHQQVAPAEHGQRADTLGARGKAASLQTEELEPEPEQEQETV